MRKGIAVINGIVAALMIIFIILIQTSRLDADRSIKNRHIQADTGWFYEDGSEATLSDINYSDGTAVIYRDINSEEFGGLDLCFISTNVNFVVYLDGERIYDYTPRLDSLYGTSYGNDFHYISLPGLSEKNRLSMELYQLGGGSMWCGMQDAYFESGAEYMNWYIDKNHWKYQIALVIFAAGFILLILGISVGKESGQQIELISLGTLTMVLSLWTDSGTLMMEMFTRNAGMVRMLNYATLVVLPVPAITLVACLTRNRDNKLFYTVIILAVVNIVVHVVGIIGGILDYHDLLIFTHGVFLLGVIIAIYLSIRSVRHHLLDEGQVKTVLSAFFILVVSGMTDLIFYYMKVSQDMSRFSRFGLLLFVGILSVYEVRQFLLMAEKSREATLLDRLAHEDGLTGLYNRLAFNEMEQDLQERDSGRGLIIQFDINNLKKVNDTYGHGEGDAFIIGGAESIKNSFGHYGSCYRTGGDEFIVVIEGDKAAKHFEECEKKLAVLVKDYNELNKPPVELTIAYGMAEYDCGTGNIPEAEKLADDRMYEHKKMLKAQR